MGLELELVRSLGPWCPWLVPRGAVHEWPDLCCQCCVDRLSVVIQSLAISFCNLRTRHALSWL